MPCAASVSSASPRGCSDACAGAARRTGTTPSRARGGGGAGSTRASRAHGSEQEAEEDEDELAKEGEDARHDTPPGRVVGDTLKEGRAVVLFAALGPSGTSGPRASSPASGSKGTARAVAIVTVRRMTRHACLGRVRWRASNMWALGMGASLRARVLEVPGEAWRRCARGARRSCRCRGVLAVWQAAGRPACSGVRSGYLFSLASRNESRCVLRLCAIIADKRIRTRLCATAR